MTDETVIYLDLGQVIEIHAATMKSMGQPAYPLSRPGDLESALGRARIVAHDKDADLIQYESMGAFPRIDGYWFTASESA